MRDAARRSHDFRAPRPELYDLRSDPAEEQNLAGADPERAANMAGELDDWVAGTTEASAETMLTDAELGVLPIDNTTLGRMKPEKLAAKERLLRIYDAKPH